MLYIMELVAYILKVSPRNMHIEEIVQQINVKPPLHWRQLHPQMNVASSVPCHTLDMVMCSVALQKLI